MRRRRKPFLRRGGHPDPDELVIASAYGTAVARIPSAIRQELRYLCTRLDVHGGGLPASIAVTSAITGEGVTFVARALAAVLSQDVGRRTCLVEADWNGEQPDVTDRNAGLAGMLGGGDDWENLLSDTRYERLSILESGRAPQGADLLHATEERMADVLAKLGHRFDHVILDLPAATASPLAMSFASAAEASLLVARQRATRIDQVEAAVADLRHTRFLGVVLNDNVVHMPRALQRRVLGV